MGDELVKMGDQFKGLPMADLIGGPLRAACDAQLSLAKATADYINVVGFQTVDNEDTKNDPGTNTENQKQVARVSTFQFTKLVTNAAGDTNQYTCEVSTPLLALAPPPNLRVTKVNVTFDMEVKSSFREESQDSKEGNLDASAKIGFGVFSATVNISGSISSHKEQTRASDNSAKYHVEVLAEDQGTPEGLARILDIIASATEPVYLGNDGKRLDSNLQEIVDISKSSSQDNTDQKSGNTSE